MKKYFHNKLIRDRIPEHIKANGGEYEIKVLNAGEFEPALRKKLVEEAVELQKAGEEELVNEMADVLELLRSTAELHGIDFKLVEEKQVSKREKRGGFKKRLFLIWSSNQAGK